MEASATTWELDSDEIASIASEDLYEHRPNRWMGAKSTWRTLTEEDRLLWQSMKQIKDQDLAVHLYNAFALKRRGRNPETAQDLVVRTESGEEGVWAPPKAWTAWPLKHKHVPKECFTNEQHDEDDHFTFRREEEILPSTELEEEISATILRTAKRRFRRRKSKMAKPSIEEDSTPLYNESMNYLSDSSTEEESDNQSQSGQKRSRGRPRKILHEVGTSASTSPAGAGKTSRRGRPRKVHIPHAGESHEEMLQRVARESHRKIPSTLEDRDAAFEEWIRKGDEIIERERSRSLSLKRATSQGAETEEESVPGTNAERKLLRWGLRDWSDVLGAAAIAGFSGDVIARATRRCADLFGEGMVVRTLKEVPATNDKGTTSVEYRPEPIQLSYSDEEANDESDDAADLIQRRIASRQASLAYSSRSPDSVRSPSRHSTRSPGPSSAARSPSSRSNSAGGMLFCPIPSCDRAAQGFARKANLRRHMELIHQGQTEELDSDEEVAGGVHVDGFLKPIVPGRGWRGEDTIQRKRKRFYGDKPGMSRETSYAEEDLSS
ncbi:Rrn9 domain [Fusarium oxysporum f. sp. vasinfectum]|nr:Rrn9 domain [Fusarium oxysporum f. sp. vasinfectum]